MMIEKNTDKNSKGYFDKMMSVILDDMYHLSLSGSVPLEYFLLNPRRIRNSSDFLMRWSQGVWSETVIINALNSTKKYFAIAYGASSVAPNDPIESEHYFDRLEKSNPPELKRPDILVYLQKDKKDVEARINELGGLEELPFTNESEMKSILNKALIGIECENSLWVTKKMPECNTPLRPMRRLGGKAGLPKNAKTPVVIIKKEDLKRIVSWQTKHQIPIHSWQIFYDMGIGISLNRSMELINDGYIEPTEQKFAESTGSVTKKIIYKIYHHYSYFVGNVIEPPKLVADTLIDKNGHVLPYVRFTDGAMSLDKRLTEDSSWMN